MDDRGGGGGRHSTRPNRGKSDPMGAGLSHLARRARTIAQMRTFLRGKGHPDPDIDRVISRLVEMGYLNDRDFAERYIASSRSRPRGRARLASELMTKGVPREIVDSTLASCFGAAEESEALNLALAKAVPRADEGLDAAGRRRVASRLLRKGFAPGKVMDAIAAIGQEPSDDLPDGPSGLEEEDN